MLGIALGGYPVTKSKLVMEKKWYAAYTRSRHEKAVRDNLDGKAIESFLPLLGGYSLWKDRKKFTEKPLFPGYVFVKTDECGFLDVLKTRGVVCLVGFDGSPAAVPAKQLDDIRRLIESKVGFDTCPYLTAGREVYVKRGALEGMQGRVVERRGTSRLIMSVDLIKRSVSVEVDVLDVELA